AVARHRDRARRAARGRRNRRGARARARRATVFRRRAPTAGCDLARRRGGRRRDRHGDRGHAARGRSRGEPAVVRRGPGRRGGAGVAAVTRTRRPPLGRSLLRLFTVQGSWNYERLQGIGVALGLGMDAVLGFLVVYNVGHVALRWWALRAGWTHGVRVAVALHQPFLQRAAAWSGPAMALVIGAALPLSAAYLAGPFPAWARGVLLGAAAVGGAILLWWRGRLSGLRYGLA